MTWIYYIVPGVFLVAGLAVGYIWGWDNGFDAANNEVQDARSKRN